MHPWQYVLDLVLPRFCVHCKREGTWLCHACRALIKTPTEFHCPLCETVSPGGRICYRHPHAAITAVLSAGFYHDPILRATLHRFKYRYAEELATVLGGILGQTAQKYRTMLPHTPIVIPVPLTSHRTRTRGFNQSDLLASSVAHTLGTPLFTKNLVRAGNGERQATLTNEERRNNLTNAFVVHHPEAIQESDILLIDDVLTTGTTIEVAARALRNAGARSVTGLVLARG